MVKLKGATIIGGGKKEDRQQNDYYPTPKEVTIALLKFLSLDPTLSVWEPACGDGSMSKEIEKFGHYVYSTDLREDSGFGVGGLDFLNADETYTGLFDVIITNPPFNLAQGFIEKALNQAGTVAIMTKSTYWHAKKRSSLYRENPPAYLLPLTWRPDFLGGGNPTMDCMWTVWIAENTKCQYVPLDKP